MAKRLLKCYGTCNKKYPQEEMKKYRNKNNFCHDCYNKKEKDDNDRAMLYETIQTTFNLSYPSGLMLRQIKEYREERNYTYRNIAFTINYITKIKKMTLRTPSGIALVPHFYDEMINYYKELQRRRETTNYKALKPQQVTIKKFDTVNHYRNKKLINMDDLLGGTENNE